MGDNEKFIKKIILVISIIIFLVLLLFIILDYVNIKKYQIFSNFTNQYDWLAIVGSIIGGLIGAVGTYIGIYLTIKNEREINNKKEINEKKKNCYSYVTFTNDPVNIEISLDSIYTGLIDESQNILIAENVKNIGAFYSDIELNFKNLNNNYPTAVTVEDMKIKFSSEVKDNIKYYKEFIDLTSYSTGYKPITIKNADVVAFNVKILINKNQMNKIKKQLINDDYIELSTNVSFINANGVVTNGKFWANLIKKSNIKTGNKNILGSNKEKINYKAENTYFLINSINYIDDYKDKLKI